MTTRNKYDVKPEKFVEVWMEVHSKNGIVDDVAEALGMPKNAVVARYTNYKKDRADGTPGVPLPQLKRKKSSKSLDIDKLTAMVAPKETETAAE